MTDEPDWPEPRLVRTEMRGYFESTMSLAVYWTTVIWKEKGAAGAEGREGRHERDGKGRKAGAGNGP
jgi:hypothetical protein